MDDNRNNDQEFKSNIHNCLECSSKFKQKFNLTRHIKSLHTQDKLQCNQCDYSSGRKDVLEKHKRRKHTIKKCDECDFTTYKNIELASHVMSVHPPDDYTEKSAFNRKFVNITFKIKDETSPMETLQNYRGKVKKILKHELQEKEMLKSYITIKIIMSKVDQEGENIERDARFNGQTICLLNEEDIDEFYDESTNDILEDFAEFNENGSSWIFERVVDLQLNNFRI